MGPLGKPCQHYRPGALRSASGLVFPPQVGSIFDVEVVTLLDESQGFRLIASLQRLDDGALMADLHDCATQNGVIVSPKFQKDSPYLGEVAEILLELADEHQRMVLSLALLEAAVSGRSRSWLSGHRGHREHARESVRDLEPSGPSGCGRAPRGALPSRKPIARPAPPRPGCRRCCGPCDAGRNPPRRKWPGAPRDPRG